MADLLSLMMVKMPHCASPALKQGFRTSHCLIIYGHCGPGDYWVTPGLEKKKNHHRDAKIYISLVSQH